MYILTGSQQLAVSASISQSLAGRTALLRLLPFSIAEMRQIRPEATLEQMLHTGFYPRIYDQDLDPTKALGDYVETYVERDVRQILEVRNLTTFGRFLRLAAGRTGQLLNLQSLGADAGISHSTAREWMSVLEASYIVFLLAPYHANLSKRLVKSPKLYFHDVGLASHLIGIERPRQLETHPLRGALFENLVILEALKQRFNRGLASNLHFYRDSSGLEVDLLYGALPGMVAVEVKSGATIASDTTLNLDRLSKLLPDSISHRVLVYGGRESYTRQGVEVTEVAGLEPLLTRLEGATD